MRINTLLTVLVIMSGCFACEKVDSTTNADVTKKVLLQQFKTTNDKQEWFVPLKNALDGVTAEQADWRDSSTNHSIGQLAHHLLFWNKRLLLSFNGKPVDEFKGDNTETFTAFSAETWDKTVASLDSVMTAIDKTIADADETRVKELYPTIANMNVHNAYHTGQIISVRKLQGSWDPEKGVK